MAIATPNWVAIVSGWTNPFEKYARQNCVISPNIFETANHVLYGGFPKIVVPKMDGL